MTRSAGRGLGAHARRRSLVLLAAVLLTLLNAFKPLVIDDTASFYYARQIAEHPGDPYGFEVFWYDYPEPANHVLMPPLLPYWLAGAVALFGDRPVLWKLWLFPFPLILAAALSSLLARFARGVETPLFWITLLSPALLPSLNLMLDVPTLALELLAIVVFVRACERNRLSIAALAGVLAGLAIQTKYPGVLALAAMGAYAAIFQRWRLGLVAASTAALLFVGWEFFVATRYGESHFLQALNASSSRWPEEKAPLLWSIGFMSILGATAPAMGLLGLAALRAHRFLVLWATATASLVFAVLPLMAKDPVAALVYSAPNLAEPRPELWFFAGAGLLVSSIMIAAVWALLTKRLPQGRRDDLASGLHAEDVDSAKENWFLVVWLVIEILGFFLVSPFLAVRRILTLTVILALVTGRLATRTVHRPSDTRRIKWITGWAVALGFLFFIADFSDALARRRAVSMADRRLAELGADRRKETVWYLGHWGFQFYAESRGMRPIIPDQSRLSAGDWLIIPEGVLKPLLKADPELWEIEATVTTRSPWPWTTVPSFYSGPVPIRSQPDSHMLVGVARVKREFVPALVVAPTSDTP